MSLRRQRELHRLEHESLGQNVVNVDHLCDRYGRPLL